MAEQYDLATILGRSPAEPEVGSAVRQSDVTQLIELLKRSRSEAEQAHLDTVRRLARAAEYKDDQTGMHLERMSRYCRILARRAGMSPARCELLFAAAPMHDVGKIGVPDAILLKPGPLTGDEFEVMKTHTLIGADLLSEGKAAVIRLARTVALTHHERYDGLGYPQGLQGEDIPLEGRIASLADVFDALTTVRPYKRAFSVKYAVDLIRQDRGLRFDPWLVDVFLEAMPEIKETRTRWLSDDESIGG
ncbi:MAG: HD-GYP domain-containing protein [Desulfovibrionaceae bacterium]